MAVIANTRMVLKGSPTKPCRRMTATAQRIIRLDGYWIKCHPYTSEASQ